MHIISAQNCSISLRALAVAGACALMVAGCGDKTPPAPAQAPATQAAAPAAPQAQPAPAPQLPVETKPDPDKVLAAKVQDALRAKLGSLADGVDVTASGGTVTLWGTVPETAKRRAAVHAASGVAGVKAVKDNMAIVAGS